VCSLAPLAALLLGCLLGISRASGSSQGGFLAGGGAGGAPQEGTSGPEEVFEPAGPDRACRGVSETDDSPAYFTVFEGTGSIEECKAHCLGESLCTGIEYWGWQGRCEVWKQQIGTTAEAPGFGCWRHEPAPGFSAADGGLGRVCRGAGPEDTQDSYYDLHEDVASLYSCEELCVHAPACVGIAYWAEGRRCELWTQSIGATAESPGFVCLRFERALPTPAPAGPPPGSIEQQGAMIPVGGEVRLYAVGSSNAPWQTWPDQLHQMLRRLGYATPVLPFAHPDARAHPTSAPKCDDDAELAGLETPRLGKVGWSSWGFAFENQDDCQPNAEGVSFRDILGHRVGCTNAWACDPRWCCGVGSQAFIRPSDIAQDARHSQVTVLSNWINDSKQRHARNVCFDGEAIDPVDSTAITLFNLKRVIEKIHERNSQVVVAVLALYPDAHGPYVVEQTLPQVAEINARVRAGLEAWGEPNVVFANYTLPSGKAVYQTMHTGHANCRGDKVLAVAVLEALYRQRVLARGPALTEGAACLAREDCGALALDCCQRSALCKVVGSGTCVAYGAGEQ